MMKSEVQVVARILALMKEYKIDPFSTSYSTWAKMGYDAGYRDGEHDAKREGKDG